MISELSSLLSSLDTTAARANGHKFSVNLNRNRIRSISAYSSNSIFYFTTIVSDQCTPEEVTMVSRFLEKNYASFVVACIGLMPFHRIKADDQASIEEYLSQFHQNMGIKNGNGAAISKAINVASRLSEGTETLTELNRSIVEAIRGGVSDEDIAMTQNFLQECWDRSRRADSDYINVVNESIVSLNDKFSKDAIDPVTRTLQEAYKATLHELDTWGFLGEATVDMNLWDDLEALSDDELRAIMDPYNGETIGDFEDDEDLEDEYPELDTMLESTWEDYYKKAKETMSNSEAVAYANQQLAKAKEAAGKAKEVAVQKTKDVTSDLSNKAKAGGQVLKSEAEKLSDKVKDAINKRIIKEGYADENSGALDRQNQQVQQDEARHAADDKAKARTMAQNFKTSVEQAKAEVARAREERLAAKQAQEQGQAVQAAQNEAATLGQAVESIKFSLQSVSADKINGCKSIGQLNKLDAKLKKLRARYNSYLNRYKKKAQAEEKKGNSVLTKFHSATIGDPKAFMLQYGSYIKEINARIEMIRRRKKVLAPDIGKEPVDESQFATIGDLELGAIDYCIESVDAMLNAPDEEVFDIIVDESMLTENLDTKALVHKKIEEANRIKADRARNATISRVLFNASKNPAKRDYIGKAIKGGLSPREIAGNLGTIVDSTGSNADSINEAKSFAVQYEKLMKQYNQILDRSIKNKRFLLGFKVGSNNRKLTGWTGKGGIIPSAMNDEDLAKLEEFLLKRQETGMFPVYGANNKLYDDTADLVDLLLARRKVLSQRNLASPTSTIPQAKIDELHKQRDDARKELEEKERLEMEQMYRKYELEIRKEEADAKKNMGVAAAAAAATYALNSINARNESAVIDEAGQPSNKNVSYAGDFKKITGGVKDVYNIYDIIQSEKDRADAKTAVNYTKKPKTTDTPDSLVHYQNNRQRGGLNVAAAANAQETKGYAGHRTFETEVFTNMDMKKANEAIPTFAKATIGFIVDETEQVVTRDVLVGIKTVIHPIRANELISELYNTLINHRKFLKFVKFISGEERSLTDLMFGIKELRLDARASSNSNAARWIPAFRRRQRLNKIAVPYLMKDYVPNGTICVTMNEVNHIKSEYGIDMLRPDHIEHLMHENFLLGFVVLDQANERVLVTYDGHGGQLQQYTYTALEREQQSTDRMIRDLYRTISR